MPTNIPSWLRLARSYARATNPITFIARRSIKKLADTVNLQSPPGGLCIDVGAGTAPYGRDAEKHLHVRSYVALDIVASESTSVIGNAMEMPFRSGCAQFIVCFDVIQHVPESKALLAEVTRVLAPGGILLVTFPFNYCECDVQDFRRWTLAGMEREITDQGLEVIRMEQRGGRFFAFACGLNWIAQHMVPGQRESWRARRSTLGILRVALVHLLTMPTTALQWAMLGIDRLLPNKGCYMGGIAMAARPASNSAHARSQSD